MRRQTLANVESCAKKTRRRHEADGRGGGTAETPKRPTNRRYLRVAREQTCDCYIRNASAPREAALQKSAASGAQQSQLRYRGCMIACA